MAYRFYLQEREIKMLGLTNRLVVFTPNRGADVIIKTPLTCMYQRGCFRDMQRVGIQPISCFLCGAGRPTWSYQMFYASEYLFISYYCGHCFIYPQFHGSSIDFIVRTYKNSRSVFRQALSQGRWQTLHDKTVKVTDLWR